MTPNGSRKLATFFVDQLCMGIDVREVREILQGYQLTRVPLAGDTIAGLINLRGEIVTAFDMRRILRCPERDADTVPTGIVVQHDGRPMGLLVDAIGDVLDVSTDLFEPPPETLQGAARELIDGAYKLNTQLLLSLDVRKATEGARR